MLHQTWRAPYVCGPVPTRLSSPRLPSISTSSTIGSENDDSLKGSTKLSGAVDASVGVLLVRR